MSEKKIFCSRYGVPMPEVIDGKCSYACSNQIFHLMEDHFYYQGKPVSLNIKEHRNKYYVMYSIPIQEDNK